MSAALLPWIRQTFLDANGAPLAAGSVETYAAGTSTPQAAYTDSSGTTPLANPVVLDASGSASIWLGPLTYRFVVKDASGATVETIDNVSAISLAQLQSSQTFSSVTVSGDEEVDGNLTVGGTLTAATLDVTGTATISVLAAATAAISGNETVAGTLEVDGASTLAALTAGATTVSGLTIGSTSLHDFVTALIPAITAASTRSDTGFFIVRVPLATQTLEIGFGSGVIASGSAIALPTGFSFTNASVICSINHIYSNSTSSTLQVGAYSIDSSGRLSMYTQGTDGIQWPESGSPTTQTANWLAIIWRTF